MNDICERAIAYWEENHKILPEIFGLRGDLIEEVIDGINDTYRELIDGLREICYG